MGRARHQVNMARRGGVPGLGYLVKWAERALRADLDAALRPLGVSTPAYTALSVLRGSGALSSAQLARRSFVSAQAMHPIVTELEAKGWVRHPPGPARGRAREVVLTPRGRTLLVACDRACGAVEAAIFGALSGPQRLQLRRLLDEALAGAARARRGEAA